MDSIEKIETLLLSAGILETSCEAAAMVFASPDNQFLLDDIQIGIETICDEIAVFQKEKPENWNTIRSQLKEVLKQLGESPARIKSLLKSLNSALLEYRQRASVEILNHVNQIDSLDGEIAEQVFAFCDTLIHARIGISQGGAGIAWVLLWRTAVKSAKTLPLQSYQRALQAFESDPDLGLLTK